MATSHRKRGLLARCLRHRRRVPVQGRVGVVVVDVDTQVAHRVESEALLAGSRSPHGLCKTVCGTWVVAHISGDRGRAECERCAP